MPSFPSKIKAGHVVYTVVRESNIKDDKGLGLYGCVTKSKALIKIDKDVDPQVQSETLIHECLHALLYDMPIDINPELNEQLCIYLGVGIKELIKNNPKLVRFIQDV